MLKRCKYWDWVGYEGETGTCLPKVGACSVRKVPCTVYCIFYFTVRTSASRLVCAWQPNFDRHQLRHLSAQCQHSGGYSFLGRAEGPNAAYHPHFYSMSQTTHQDLEGGNERVTRKSDRLHHLIISATDDHRDDHRDDLQPTPSYALQGESNFGDSSGPLFSIYSKAAEEEDNKMVERWQKDADGILIFVSPRMDIHADLCINWNTIDRFILCRCRCTPLRDRPGPQAKQSGYLCFLPWKHLPGSRRSGRNTCFHLIHRQATPVFSSEICCLGEFTLVLELGYEPQLCTVGNIVTSMGTSIYPSHTTCTVQSREAGANACILCRGR